MPGINGLGKGRTGGLISLFGSYSGTSEPREAALLKQGFSKLLTGKSTYDVDKTDAVKHISVAALTSSSSAISAWVKFFNALGSVMARWEPLAGVSTHSKH